MIAVLQARGEIASARSTLSRRGLTSIRGTSLFHRALRKLFPALPAPVGDYLKSWDVHRTVSFIESHLPTDGVVLDVGAYSSEVPFLLKRLNYRRVAAVDLNPDLARMPRNGIWYVLGDFTKAPVLASSIDVVTAISVIEHGFDQERLLCDVAAMLKPGGYFIASVDYWPEKRDTQGIVEFGMSWTIFSRAELLELLRVAEKYGLRPVGAVDLDASQAVIRWNRRSYTFAWFVLQKSA